MTRTRDIATQGGLVLLNNTSFSAVSSVSISNVFDSTYSNYRIAISLITSSANQTISFRCRENATDKATDYLGGTFTVSYLAATAATGNNGGTAFLIATNMNTDNPSIATLDIYRTATKCTYSSIGWNGQAATANFQAGQQVNMTNFTGFSFFPSNTGTMTGSVKVYGYK